VLSLLVTSGQSQTTGLEIILLPSPKTHGLDDSTTDSTKDTTSDLLSPTNQKSQ
jgi:hypothetical protein